MKCFVVQNFRMLARTSPYPFDCLRSLRSLFCHPSCLCCVRMPKKYVTDAFCKSIYEIANTLHEMFRHAEGPLARLHVALASDLTRPVVINFLRTSLHHYLPHVLFAHSTILFSSSKPMDTQKGCFVSDAKLQSVSKHQWQKQYRLLIIILMM